MLLHPERLNAVKSLQAAFTLRTGGVSKPPYDTLNLGLSTGDEEGHVQANRERVWGILGFTRDQAAVAGQVHGSAVRVVDAGGLYPGYDGLVTRTPGVLLCIAAADCAAILLADADARVIGACHAGWRGTVACIAARTIEVMKTLGADPARMIAYVSPCISRDAFEVGPEVAQQFDEAFVHPRPGANPHVDLKGALEAQLHEAGVPRSAIDVAPHCTASDTERFFSYRAEQGTTGRMMGLIGWSSDVPGPAERAS